MSFSRATLGADALASVVVFLVALPLCMGIAIASGFPPAAGLISGIIGGIVVGSLQGAPLQVSGPAAGLTVLMFDLVRTHGIGRVGVIVAIAGVMQMGLSLIRAGRWFRAVSPAVIRGMLSGIGVLILASQFHVMVDDKPRHNGVQNLLSIPESILKGITPMAEPTHREAAAIGILTIALIIAWSWLGTGRLKLVPPALIAVTVATLVCIGLDLPVLRVKVPDSLLGAIQLPTGAAILEMLKQPSTYSSAAATAVIASAETLLCAGAVDQMHDGPRTDYNRELLAQGLGNTLCGVVGALPMTGVIVRSSANVQAGGKTRLSSILHGFWLIVMVSALPFLLQRVPVAGLAAVLVLTGYKLIDVKWVREMAKRSKSEVFIFAVTLCGIVATDLLKGVMLGVAAAAAKLVWTFSRVDARITHEEDGSTKVRLRGAATFLNLPRLAEILEALPTDRKVTLDVWGLIYADHAAHDLIKNWEAQRAARGTTSDIPWKELDRTAGAGEGARGKAPFQTMAPPPGAADASGAHPKSTTTPPEPAVSAAHSP